MILDKYSFGLGDRFGQEAVAQLQAVILAQKDGVQITPVWNKSHREHTIIKTSPDDVRAEADAAVKAVNWKQPYYVDADHIGLNNVDLFIKSSDFFTLDVAEFIGRPAPEDDKRSFVDKYKKYVGTLDIPGIDAGLEITKPQIEAIADKFLLAVKEAGRLYRHIESVKGAENFITEVSMDETDQPQSPVEMLFILAAIADEGIPAQTIAPKFTGRFNKGVDYVGDIERFSREFEQDLAVISFAVKEFALPANLKLSIHSGSDKFSIYRPINQALKKFDAGLHIKTAGTTWLEELIGLASAGRKGLQIAKEIYKQAFSRFDELCRPYATVIDIDKDRLPTPEVVQSWSGEEFVSALRHDPSCSAYDPNFRQLLHVGYKIAAEMGDEFVDALRQYREIIALNVTQNIYARHIKPIFIG